MKINLFKRIAASFLAAALSTALVAEPLASFAEMAAPAITKAPASATHTEAAQFKAPEGYNENDYNKLRAFLDMPAAEGAINGEYICGDYNPNAPETWTGVFWTFTDSGLRVKAIDWSYTYVFGYLDLSDCTALTDVRCAYGNISGLNVSNDIMLSNISCQSNMISDLNLSNTPSLVELNCSYNMLTELDLSKNTIVNFSCTENPLKKLIVGSNWYCCVESISVEGDGSVGIECTYTPPEDGAEATANYIMYAYPEHNSNFNGWYTPEGELLSTDYVLVYADQGGYPLFYNVDFIASFSGGSQIHSNGDIDGDGEVTTGDALATIRNAMGLQDMSAEQIAAADMDGDGQVTTSDALIIIRIAMGI